MKISKHCRVAVFDHMIVALDLKRSRYFLYDQPCATAFATCYIDQLKIEEIASLEPMILDGIVTQKPSHRSVDRELICDHRSIRFDTFDTGTWGNRTLTKHKTSRCDSRSLFRIVASAISLKFFGFTALSVLERIRPRSPVFAASLTKDFSGVIDKYLGAAMWSPFRITCLPLAFSLVACLRKSNIPAQLVIGVRPTPFVAHAWIEIDGNVYGDDPHLTKSYGEIYRTPRYDAAR